ncbi:LPXTG cell wall anchor domain-containing protein [Evansella sp. LMS18]|uniref:LPXTG cell wall anchor domain-containing protein n=1 Tax=Evansella sp. LMS18 TaxID=2924033 RepID=UPI0020D1827C|nr:LPXTG cell wall anchor domain-containing protein [Evansella sp. LMS18]UTR11974.1 LPXTG cell wall anchor domain-containing protein [Evansella sp. LMS18]
MIKKRSLTAFGALSLSMLLIGTNSTVANEDLTAEDVLNQSNEAMESLHSYSSTIDLHQLMDDGISGEMEMYSEIQQDVILDPFKLRQVMTSTLPDGSTETITSYFTEDGYFMEDPEGGWMQLTDDMNDMNGTAYDPNDQIYQMEAYADDLVLSEEGGYYVITYEGDGDELSTLMNDLTEEGMSDEDTALMEEMMAEFDIHDFSYVLYIDTDTYFLDSMVLELDMEIHAEGEASVSIWQDLDMSFYNFNSVEDFEIPQEALEESDDVHEVIDEAIEEAEEGDELPATATNNPIMAFGGLLLAMAAGGVLLMRRRIQRA